MKRLLTPVVSSLLLLGISACTFFDPSPIDFEQSLTSKTGTLREKGPEQASREEGEIAAKKSTGVTRLWIFLIQRDLASLGYGPGPADAILGRKTRAAIRAFQVDQGLPVTGEISVGFLTALHASHRRHRSQ